MSDYVASGNSFNKTSTLKQHFSILDAQTKMRGSVYLMKARSCVCARLRLVNRSVGGSKFFWYLERGNANPIVYGEKTRILIEILAIVPKKTFCRVVLCICGSFLHRNRSKSITALWRHLWSSPTLTTLSAGLLNSCSIPYRFTYSKIKMTCNTSKNSWILWSWSLMAKSIQWLRQFWI